MDILAPHTTHSERKGEEKHSRKFPQSVFSCEDLLEFLSISNHSQHLLERGRAKSVCQQTVSSVTCFLPIMYMSTSVTHTALKTYCRHASDHVTQPHVQETKDTEA